MHHHGPMRARRRRGTALIVVLVLAMVMLTYVVGNSVVLGQLRGHLNLVERRHLERYAADPAVELLAPTLDRPLPEKPPPDKE